MMDTLCQGCRVWRSSCREIGLQLAALMRMKHDILGGKVWSFSDAGSGEGETYKVTVTVKETVMKVNVLILSFSYSQQCYEHLLPSGWEARDSV